MKFTDPAIQSIVRRMTNWQRNQWAKAKYPIDEVSLKRFATMKRRPKALGVVEGS